MSRGEVVVEDRYARAGERGLHLAGRTGDFGPALPALPELVRVSEAGSVEQVFDVADETMPGQFGRAARRPVAREIVPGGVEAQRIVGELAGNEPAMVRTSDHDGDVGFPLRQREGARHGDELDVEGRVAVRQLGKARRERETPKPSGAPMRTVPVNVASRSASRASLKRNSLSTRSSTFASSRPASVSSHPVVRRMSSCAPESRSSVVIRRLSVAWLSPSVRAAASN